MRQVNRVMNLVLADYLKLTGILLLVIFLGSCGGSNSESVANSDGTPLTAAAILTWLPPTTYVDGSTLANLAKYKIYYGTSPDSLTNVILINNPGLTSYVIDGLPGKVTYYFAVTAIDSVGLESSLSNIASKYIEG